MLVYKFRTLNRFDWIYHILVNKVIHCSRYQDLNDPFEGEYLQLLNSSICGIAECGVAECGNDGDLQFIKNTNYKICSFSKSFTDVRMWSHYADGHKGICIEFELDGYDPSDLSEVKYEIDLKEVNKAITDKTVKKILSRKSSEWSYEEEIRLFSTDEYHKIKGKISRIIVGCRISDIENEMLLNIAKDIRIEKEVLRENYKITTETIYIPKVDTQRKIDFENSN